MLLLYLQFFSLIRLLLREFRVILLLLLLDRLAFLLLLRVELFLLLLVLGVQLWVRGGWNNRPRGSRNLVWMDCRSRSRPVAWGWLRRVVRVYRAICGFYVGRRYRLVLDWLGIVGWYRPVGGSIWWTCCIWCHGLGGVGRWDRAIPLLRLRVLRMTGPVCL